jgi:hypothetical protein
MRHGALAWTAPAAAQRHRRRPLLLVRPQHPLCLRWSTTRISSTNRQPLEDDDDGENTENGSNNLNDTLWGDDLDGIGSLFGGASSLAPPPLPTMKSSMLHFVTHYLKKSNASDATEKTTDETAWTIPELTIVSSPELDIDDDDAVGTSNDWKNISSSTENARSLQGFTSRRVYSDLLAKKAKSVYEPNPIFERYKNSTLVAPNSSNNNNGTESFNGAETSAVTVFPSAEHCIGFWRWLQSPTGFAVEASDTGSRSSSTVSDNLILRVDGTIAGGPILDAEFRHKPSGGQWDVSNDNDDHAVSLLRISLYIPPAKQRMLVLQGILRQEPPPSTPAAALSSLSNSGTISCSGTVWVQDIVPLASLDASQNRRDHVGTFAMVKLDSVNNRESYTITIPRNVRPMD